MLPLRHKAHERYFTTSHEQHAHHKRDLAGYFVEIENEEEQGGETNPTYEKRIVDLNEVCRADLEEL